MHSIYIPFIREPIATGLSSDAVLIECKYAELLFPGVCFVVVLEGVA